MPEDSPKFPLVRCPKCGRLLPELPPYSVYRCGGCHGFFRAQKKSPVSDGLCENSSEARPSEGFRRDINHGGIVGVDHDSERITPSRVSKSPARVQNSDTLDGYRNSPIRENILGPGESAYGDDRKIQLRERGHGHGKSPAFSVRRGDRKEKAPVIRTDDAKSAERENFEADLGEIEARDRLDLRRRRTVDFGLELRTDQSGEEYGKLYGRRRLEMPYDDDWADEGYVGVFGKPRTRVPVSPYDRSSNYRTELLHKYNKLHEKLIRIGDLISYSHDGQGVQDPDDYVYDEFSGLRIGIVKSAHQPPYYHQKYAARRSMDSIHNPRRKNLHHPACSCSDCHTSNLQARVYRKWTLDPTFPNPTLNHSPQPRSSVGSKLDGGSSAHDHRKKALVVNQNGQLCYPIAGGAPFVICYNCFQLLRIPGKLAAAKKDQFRLQCGSCLSILSYEFNANGFTFPCKDTEPSAELQSGSSNSTEATKKSGFSASSSQESKDEHSSKTEVSQSDVSSEADKPSMKGLLPLRPPPGSPLRDHKDYAFDTKKSEEKESDTLNGKKGTAQKKSSFMTCVGNAAVSTGLEPDSGEIQNTCTSQGSADTSARKDQGGYGEASEISSATVVKSGFRDSSSHSLHTLLAKADVFVNGKPITPYAVRRAEKMAGPISPGEYWYDSKAGFWGVMGDLCLGIIPPCIEEFSSQMPENCSGGDTCVYVNGRELHKNDLDLLSSRGLPYTRFKYYVVDISGKVLDEDTEAFVVNLGRLAPTVESTGCGFGMHSPEALND